MPPANHMLPPTCHEVMDDSAKALAARVEGHKERAKVQGKKKNREKSQVWALDKHIGTRSLNHVGNSNRSARVQAWHLGAHPILPFPTLDVSRYVGPWLNGLSTTPNI